jgi:hypothetical protein
MWFGVRGDLRVAPRSRQLFKPSLLTPANFPAFCCYMNHLAHCSFAQISKVPVNGSHCARMFEVSTRDSRTCSRFDTPSEQTDSGAWPSCRSGAFLIPGFPPDAPTTYGPPTATHHFLQTWRHCKFTLLRLLMSYQGVDICASQPNAITGDPLHTANEVTLCI